MIKSISVDGLFDRFDYKISFKKGLNIVSGPNGFGKTTILRIINDVLEDDLLDLTRIPFKKIVLKSFSDDVVIFEKKEGQFSCNGEVINIPESIEETYRDNYRLIYKNLSGSASFNRIIVDNNYFSVLDSNGKETLFKDLLIKGDLEYKNLKESQYVIDLATFYGNVGNAYFLDSNRLFNQKLLKEKSRMYRGASNDDNVDFESIKLISPRLIKIFSQYTNLYTKLSNSNDSLFLLRLTSYLYNEKEVKYDEKKYLNDVKMIQESLSRLYKYNLVNPVEIKTIPRDSFSQEYALVFKIFIENFKKKLQVFDVLLKKLDLFIQIINEKFVYKKISISNEKGIEVKDGDKIIELTSLSSGEKELIVMYYNLIFNEDGMSDKNYNLYLVDEPEISLHVEWQSQVLDDIEKIIDLNKNENKQYIVCTHSPQIIGNRWEELIDLAELASKN